MNGVQHDPRRGGLAGEPFEVRQEILAPGHPAGHQDDVFGPAKGRQPLGQRLQHRRRGPHLHAAGLQHLLRLGDEIAGTAIGQASRIGRDGVAFARDDLGHHPRIPSLVRQRLVPRDVAVAVRGLPRARAGHHRQRRADATLVARELHAANRNAEQAHRIVRPEAVQHRRGGLEQRELVAAGQRIAVHHEHHDAAVNARGPVTRGRARHGRAPGGLRRARTVKVGEHDPARPSVERHREIARAEVAHGRAPLIEHRGLNRQQINAGTEGRRLLLSWRRTEERGGREGQHGSNGGGAAAQSKPLHDSTGYFGRTMLLDVLNCLKSEYLAWVVARPADVVMASLIGPA